jgi:hypothetical protein
MTTRSFSSSSSFRSFNSFVGSGRIFAGILLGTVALVLATSTAGCAGDASIDGIDDEGDDEGASSSAISSGARWSPPNVKGNGTYSGSGAWSGGKGCTGGMLPGTQTLRTKVSKAFKTTVDGYACRPNTADTSKVSMHGTGRALDIYATGASGTKIADYLVNNHQALGIQLVIWSRSKWNIQVGGGAYTGPNPHTDHIHAELTPTAAKNATKPDINPSGSSGAPSTDNNNNDDNDTDNDNDPVDNTGGGGKGGEPTSNAEMFGKPCGSSHGVCNPGNNGSGLMCKNGVCVVGCINDTYCPGIQICSAGRCQ